ncbi:MAG: RNA methyltransferase [Bacteroidetes bacterium]|nr:RNA methyltransferase [Bacteroidota bacterium]
MALEITSLKNPRLKLLASLEKSKDRRELGLFIIEGVREISLAQQGGFEIEAFYVCPEIFIQDSAYSIDLVAKDVLHLPAAVFSKVAYRENTGGIIAIAKTKSTGLGDLPVQTNGLYLVLEKVEKPGNIGAMLRTADAAGLNGVIVCDPATDFYNPNVVRSSVGCLFTVPIASATNQQVLDWCRLHGIQTCAAALTARQAYDQVNFKTASAILMGSESEGLSDFWLKQADQQIIIPMKGRIDSMNVSNAAAILIFEAVRQRRS